MPEIRIGTQYYANRLQAYRQMNEYSCASAALRIAYKAFDINRSEREIRNDLGLADTDCIHWPTMCRHAESLGLEPHFYFNNPYEVLFDPFYDNAHVIIVGWMACRNYERLHHCAPVKALTPDEIELIDPGIQSTINMRKETFLNYWYDYEYSHPFMTISKTK